MGIDVVMTDGLSEQPLGQLIQAARGALYEEASSILSDSQENYVPVDEGVLRREAYQDHPVHDAFRTNCGSFWTRVQIYDTATSDPGA